MFVPPTPIGFPICVGNAIEIPVLAMVLLNVNAISAIFMVVPMMIIIVTFIVVDAIIGSEGRGGKCQRGYESSA